jgi:6-phosphofructokinase 2
MADVVTLTMNPAIDLSVSVERVTPFHKLRSSESRRDPGGGGINVARAMKRLGADVTAIYPAGGTLGLLLRQLVELEGISQVTIPIANETREDFTVNERETGFQYRFVVPGPSLTEHEWQACLSRFTALDARTRFVVCSGSLPPGVPDDFYRRVVEATRRAGRDIIIDSSGTPLKAALAPGVYLVKPSLSELRDLFGAALDIRADQIKACRALIEKEPAEVVALTLGEQGAILVDAGSRAARTRTADRAEERGRRRRQLSRCNDLGAHVRARAGRGVPLWCRRRLRRLAHAWHRALSARRHRAAGEARRARCSRRQIAASLLVSVLLTNVSLYETLARWIISVA